jgi:hypothetical protein
VANTSGLAAEIRFSLASVPMAISLIAQSGRFAPLLERD